MPVDTFFRSLAEDQAGNAIGVILSGTANDGTAGMAAIKEEGALHSPRMPTPPSTTGCLTTHCPALQQWWYHCVRGRSEEQQPQVTEL